MFEFRRLQQVRLFAWKSFIPPTIRAVCGSRKKWRLALLRVPRGLQSVGRKRPAIVTTDTTSIIRRQLRRQESALAVAADPPSPETLMLNAPAWDCKTRFLSAADGTLKIVRLIGSQRLYRLDRRARPLATTKIDYGDCESSPNSSRPEKTTSSQYCQKARVAGLERGETPVLAGKHRPLTAES